MHSVDAVHLDVPAAIPIIVTVVGAFLIFGVSLDLEVEHFRRVLRKPKAPLIGMLAQFGILPAVAFVIASHFVDAPSVALGLILVASCPGGSGSNFLTGLARGDVATSVVMTSVATMVCVVVTPLVFAFWMSMNPATSALLKTITIDAVKVLLMLVLVLMLPVVLGMLVRAKREAFAERIRTPIRRISVVLFLLIVSGVMASNVDKLTAYRGYLLPVAMTLGIALLLGWVLARVAGLNAAERRAVTIEVGIQNVNIAITTIFIFFPTLGGALLACLFWGILHISTGFALALTWGRTRLEPAAATASP